MNTFDNDRDDFWDVSKLVPKDRPKLNQFSSSPKVRDFAPDDDGITLGEKKTSP